MFGKKELDSLDEFSKGWKEAHAAKEPAKDTGAVTNMDDFDYGDTVKDTADAKSITAASTPEVDSIASDDAKRAVQTTPAAIVPAAKPAMSFKQAFAQEYKRHKADPSSPSTFDWNGKKILLKLKSEAKPAAVQTAKPAASKPAVSTVQTAGGDFPEGESTAAAKPAAQVAKAVAPPVATGKDDESQAETSRLAAASNASERRKNNESWLPASLVGGDNSTDKKSKREIARIGVNGVSYDAMGNPAGQDAVGSMDADKKESVPAKTVTAAKKDTGSIFGNFFESSSFGSKSTGDEHRIAANGVKVDHKNKPVDTADAIANTMGVNPNTLLPNKPAVQVASK
jgi:hypothetical protein